MRYIAQRIRPKYGTPAPGTDNTLIREYVSDQNALRYMHVHLRADHFEPGQYEVRTFPKSDYRPNADRHVGYLYKQVPRRKTLTPVPNSRPVLDGDGNEKVDIVTCGTCGRSWNDARVSAVTPVPAGRCPFEYEH